MSFLKKILIIFLFLIPFSNSFAATITKIDDQVFQDAADGEHDTMGGPEFNKDGTNMFVSYHNGTNFLNDGDDDFIAEYNLSTPFDISTATYAGDSERWNTTDPDYDGTDAGDNATGLDTQCDCEGIDPSPWLSIVYQKDDLGNDTRKIGSKVTYTCNIGQSTDTMERECVENDRGVIEWNGTEPKCKCNVDEHVTVDGDVIDCTTCPDGTKNKNDGDEVSRVATECLTVYCD